MSTSIDQESIFKRLPISDEAKVKLLARLSAERDAATETETSDPSAAPIVDSDDLDDLDEKQQDESQQDSEL